ncbi:MAG: glycosyltransferase [Actinomycetota bacterium]
MTRDRLIVAHVITGLEVGGAETVLLRLLSHMDRARIASRVISLGSVGKIGPRIEELGVPVVALGRDRFRRNLPVSRRLFAALRETRPDVVQTWMYHADYVGGIGAWLARGSAVAWGLHTGPVPPDPSLAMRVGLKVNARLSHFVPDTIVCCAGATQRVHADLGYSSRKMVVIPNGFAEPPVFPNAGEHLKRTIGVSPDSVLIGRVARWHPQKDHETLIAACELVRRQSADVHLVLVGEGMTEQNVELHGWVSGRGLTGSVHYLGARDDVDRLNAGFDVAASSSSYGEAFPLVLGEAMATGTPVVSTDVGDSGVLIDDPSRVVSPGDPGSLANALTKVVTLDPASRGRLGERDKKRVLGTFSLDRMIEAYTSLYERLAREHR